MKIVFEHLINYIEENPSIENISDKLLQLGHEHEVEGNIFNMEFTPNRGDCLSINGLLRDLGAFYTVNVNKSKYTKLWKESDWKKIPLEKPTVKEAISKANSCLKI